MHPVTEVALATAAILVLGAGAVAVLPQAKPAPAQVIALAPQPDAPSRATPARPKTNAERIEALHAELAAIAAEHKRLADAVKHAARERAAR